MFDELAKKISYEFKDTALLTRALTHRSKHEDHNERLEFLGDSIVNFITAEMLYNLYPQATEGELSRWRASLINRETLADLARQFELNKYITLGAGEVKTGGRNRLSILTCTMEAIIGAIYLDGGFVAVRNCVMHWYQPLLKNLSNAASHKDPKTILQEYLQQAGQVLPLYKVETIDGEAHAQTFTVSCFVQSIAAKTLGQGTSRRRAEQAAAEVMLGEINRDK